MIKRVTVPKLNNSDLEMSQLTQENDSEIDKARKSRADVKKTIAKSAIRTNSQIIQAHLSKTSLKNATNAAAQEGTLKKKQKICDNSDAEVDDEEENSNDSYITDTEETSTKDNGEENDGAFQDRSRVLHSNANNVISNSSNHEINDIFNDPNEELNENPEGNLSSNPPKLPVNDKCAQLIQERNDLKQQISKLRSEKLAAERLSRMLHDKLKKTRETICKKDQEKAELKLKPKGLPTPICCNSNVFVRADALEEAYAKTKPSMFFQRMLYLTWGRRVLADRCVKKFRKTPDHVKVLTPKKKRAVRKHFIHYLKYYKYHSVLFNKEMNNMNSYANRAITCSKRYAQLLEEHPILATDEEAEGNIEMVEL